MEDYLFKIVVIGQSGVGKTSMTDYYVNANTVDPEELEFHFTIGMEFFSKNIQLDDKKIKLQIWDTAGQERFRSIMRSYYRDASGAIVCFSLGKKETFDGVNRYLKDLEENCPQGLPIVLVGTFSDLNERDVDIYSIEKLLNDNKRIIKYIEISSLTGENINHVFDVLSTYIAKNMDNLCVRKSKRHFTINNYIGNEKIEQDNKCCF